MKFSFFTFLFLIHLQIWSAVEFKGKFEQGSFILGKVEPGSKVLIDKREIRVSEQGYFAFGLDRDRKNDITIKQLKNILGSDCKLLSFIILKVPILFFLKIFFIN